MADYYPLIARAVAGLDPSAPGESRRALYVRAREALIAQLRSVEPPLSEAEITRERLSLEEAVRKVEAEAAQRSRDATRASRSGDAFRASTRANLRSPATAAAPPPPAASPEQAPTRSRPPIRGDRPTPPDDRSEARPSARGARPEPRPQPPQVGMPDPAIGPAGRERSARRGNEVPPAMRGFRDIAADADDLGRATAQANRAARKTYANVPSPSPEFDRVEPSMENRGADPDVPYSYDESTAEAERYAPPPQRQRISQERSEPRKRVRTGPAFPFKSAIAVGLVLILVGAGILWGKPLVATVTGLFKPASPVVEAPKDTPSERPKIADRVGQPSSSEQIAPVAQRVMLYDEDPSEPQGKQYVGSVVWRTENVKAADGKSSDLAVRADIEIPDRKFKMTMSFRRNTDTSLPASHTAELTFILPPDFDGGGVANVPGILMKSSEQARGTPLAGLAVKVTDGFFLVGLSNVDSDRTRNLQLLKERSWFDVPLVYANQRRAIIAIEKGAPGERAFNDAFAAWGQ